MNVPRFTGVLLVGVSAVSLAAAVRARTGQDRPLTTALVAGRVVDAGGIPVEGARVTRWLGVGADLTQYETVTGADGRFLFEHVAPGSWRLVAELPGYHSGAFGRLHANGPDRLLTVPAGAHINDLVIRVFKAGGVLAGLVLDDRGDPAVAVPVVALRRTGGGPDQRPTFERSPYEARTDDRGQYRIAVLDGDYTVAVPPVTLIAVPSGLPASGPEAAGRRTGPPRVIVPGAPAVGAGGLEVFLSGSGGLAPPTAAGGRIGWAYPAVVHAGPVMRIADGAVRGGLDLRVGLVPAFEVAGRVMKAGAAAPGIGLRLVAAGTPFEAGQAITGSDGSFAFQGVPAGDYVVELAEVQASETWWARQPLAVSDRVADLTIALERGTAVRGRVVFGSSGRPPGAGATTRVAVSLSPVNAPSWTLPPAEMQADGTWVTAEHVPGSYLIVVQAPPGWFLEAARHRGRDVSAEPLLLQSAPVEGVEVVLTDRVGQIVGQVGGNWPLAASDATVYVFPADFTDLNGRGSPFRKFRRVRVSDDGRYAAGNLTSGTYYVTAVADWGEALWTEVETLERLKLVATKVEVRGNATVNLTLPLRTLR